MSYKSMIVPCGIDEVGVGPVYGSMFHAMVANPEFWHIQGVKDSKKFTSDEKIQQVRDSFCGSTLFCDAYESFPWMIDSNQLPALAGGAIASLCATVGRSLVVKYQRGMILNVCIDGDSGESPISDFSFWVPASIAKTPVDVEVSCRFRWEPRADARNFECGAASIVAKTSHTQRIMADLAQDPSLARYGLATNKGYGTAEHAEALRQYGVAPGHRRRYVQSLLRAKPAKNSPAPETLFPLEK